MTTPADPKTAHLEAQRAELRRRTSYWRATLIDTYVSMETSPPRRKVDAQALWLACYEMTMAETRASDASQVTRSRLLAWKTEDPIFAKVLPQAQEAARDRLVGEATRRAVEGVLVPKYHQGRVVGHEVKYSDQLMLALLKGVDPVMFGDAKGGTKTTDGEARRQAALTALTLSPEALALAEQLAAALDDPTPTPKAE